MSRIRISVALAATIAFPLSAQRAPTVEQFMSPPSPLEMGAARKADRLAWVTYEHDGAAVLPSVRLVTAEEPSSIG